MPAVEAPPQVEVQPLGQVSTPIPAADEKPEPHIALLLPLKSAAFGASADAVHLGFLAAAGSQSHALPIKVYGSFDEGKDIVTLYQLAIANGAVAVAGPLTRDGVAALATQTDITVPTLALNLVEGKSADKLYFFGLSAEAEARQVAQLASAAKLRYATIVSTDTPLSKRLVLAFSAEWQALGGSITAEVLFNNDPAVLALLPTAPGDPVPTPSPAPLTASGIPDPNYIAPPVIAPGNMVFLAADAEKARLIRPYLNAALPVYAASQIFNSNADALTNYDLNDIRFVDMPWLLQPDHPAVMIYPRPLTPMEPDKERLYALGIDAFRL
ncbi:MAG: penicillin-binding protein activator, partial [Gallionellaceae bacterium]|nr:penicillin-binding protein activator [Gallionellaceae bacterium]